MYTVYAPEITKMIRPFVIAIIFVSIYLAEHIWPQRRDITDHVHDFGNLLVGTADIIVIGSGGYLMQRSLTFAAAHDWGLLYYLPPWVQVALGFVLADLFMYWWHRANHVIPLFWYFHRFHHKDTKLNASSAIRFHGGELFLSYIFKIPVFIALGITTHTVAIYGAILFPVVIFTILI